MRLAPDENAPKSASIPVYAVVGHWRSEKFAALLTITGTDVSPSGDKSTDAQSDRRETNVGSQPRDSQHSAFDSVSSRLPEEVLILVGQADLFPYRIEYRRLETPASGPPIPYQLSTNPMVVLELIDVVFDTPVATGQFEYAPGDADWTDQTAAVLERLRTERNQLADRATHARKK
jgi:hypothetical protein